jgi:SAM-dependent methyltransferase
MTDYLLDNAWQHQRQRLAGLEAWFDPGTVRHLEALGVGAGWRCLEVGAGGGSIAEWLCRRVGSSGHVLATDLDTRFLDALDHANLTVRRHDILTDPLPEGAFDLVHTRFVLEHLPDPMLALRRMAAALAPGGWLLVEGTDSSSWVPDPAANADSAALFARWTTAFAAYCRAGGADAFAGRRQYGQLHALGLSEIGAEGRVYMVQGGSANADVWRLTAEQVREPMVAAGLMASREMEDLLALLADPEFVWMEALVMATWGRRPVA